MTATCSRTTDSLLIAPTVYRAANGLTIVAEQMPIDVVNLNIWLDVGSAKEADAINGMAHFLEHMVFKGTDRLQSGEFERLIEQRGAITNAATSQDYTHYYITTAPKDFAELAPLQVEVLLNARFAADGFERERQVVLEEIRRSQDNPRRRTFHHASQLAFDQLPYRRQVLGSAEVVASLTAQQMRDFHRYWYHPAAMIAVAVGNLPVEQLIQIVEDSFAKAGSRASRPAQVPFLPPNLLPDAPFSTIVRREIADPSLQQARLIMMWRVPGLDQLDQTYGLDVAASVLGHGRTSRLVQDLREQRGLVSSISVSNMNYRHQGLFYISAQLPVEHVNAAETAVLEHVERLQQTPVTQAELDRIRTRVANQFIFGNETPSDRSGSYGYYQALLGDLTPALHYADHIRAVTAEALQQAAQEYLSPHAYGVVTIRPGSSAA